MAEKVSEIIKNEQGQWVMTEKEMVVTKTEVLADKEGSFSFFFFDELLPILKLKLGVVRDESTFYKSLCEVINEWLIQKELIKSNGAGQG